MPSYRQERQRRLLLEFIYHVLALQGNHINVDLEHSQCMTRKVGPQLFVK